MKITLIILFLTLLFNTQAQLNDFISIRPDMKALQDDLNDFREMAGLKDTTITTRSGEYLATQFVKKGRIVSIKILYNNISHFYWERSGRKGVIKYSNGDVDYCLNLFGGVKKIKINFFGEERSVLVVKLLGKAIVGRLPESIRPSDKEWLREILLTLHKEMPR